MFQKLDLPPGVESAPIPAVGVTFTEGPACDAKGNLYFTDIINNRILVLDAGAKYFRVFRSPSGRANGLLFDAQGRLLACEGNEFGPNDGNRRVTRTNLDTGAVEVLTDRYGGKRYNGPMTSPHARMASCSYGSLLLRPKHDGVGSRFGLSH